MKRYLDTEIALIKDQRKKYKYSFNYLSHLYNIPSSTIRNWCFADKIHTKGDVLRAFHARIREKIKKSDVPKIVTTHISNEVAKLYVALMYWCEGAKYPPSNAMCMSNSDVKLLRTFIFLLRKAFPLDENKFSIHLQIHSNQDYEKLKEYWGNQLNIPIVSSISV